MDLTCKHCNQEYQSVPIVLTCGWTVCDAHIQMEGISECTFCRNAHTSTDGNQYPVNKTIEVQLNHKKVKDGLVRAEFKLQHFKVLQSDPYGTYVSKYFDSLINAIESRQEKLISSITAHFEPMVARLREIRDRARDPDYQETLEKFRNLKLDPLENDLSVIKSDAAEEQLTGSSNSYSELNAKLKEKKKKIGTIERYMDECLDGLLENTVYELSDKSPNMNYDELFGKLIIQNKKKAQCFKTLTGHEAPVNALALTLQGELISGSRDKTLKIWDIETEKCVRTLKGHTGPINAIVLGKKGEILSGSDDTMIKVWNQNEEECVRTLTGHKWVVWALIINNWTGELISGSRDKTMKFWNVDTGLCLRTINGDQNAISSLVISLKGELVSGSIDKTIKVWNIDTGVCLKSFAGHANGIKDMVISRNGELISSSGYGPIKIFNLETGECVKTLFEHTSGVYALILNRDGELISGSDDCTIKVWDREASICLKTLVGHEAPLNALLIRKDREIISGSVDKSIRVWKI